MSKCRIARIDKYIAYLTSVDPSESTVFKKKLLLTQNASGQLTAFEVVVESSVDDWIERAVTVRNIVRKE